MRTGYPSEEWFEEIYGKPGEGWSAGTVHYYRDNKALCARYQGPPKQCKQCEKAVKRIEHLQSKHNEQELFDGED